jgi:hypothetical protein
VIGGALLGAGYVASRKIGAARRRDSDVPADKTAGV